MLVNNAGYGSYGAVEDVPLDEGRRQLKVNLFGLARMSQLVIPSIGAAPGPGGSSTSPRSAATSARPLGGVGSRQQVRCGGVQRQPAPRTARVRHPRRRDRDRARSGPSGAAGALGQRPGRTPAPGRTPSRSGRWAELYAQAETRGTEPMVIADTVLTAVQARRPKPRYATPFSAKAIIAATTLVPDRLPRRRRTRDDGPSLPLGLSPPPPSETATRLHSRRLLKPAICRPHLSTGTGKAVSAPSTDSSVGRPIRGLASASSRA